MNMTKTIIAILFVAVLLLPACAQQQPATPQASLEYSNPAQKIEVPVGVAFTITVNANPTTGYTWEAGFDQSLLKLIKRYTPSQTGMIGAGGTESFQFEGMKKGDTQIYLNYKRSFEPNNPGLETKTFHVIIK